MFSIIFTIWVYMSLWFIIGLVLKRNDVADVAWGLGFIVATAVSLFMVEDISTRALTVSLLVLVWGSRLSFHIFKRNIKKTEDARYVAWRLVWGKWFVLRSYFQVFMLQGSLLLLIVSPVLITVLNGGESSLTIFDVIGFVVWCIGFYFESVGDRQLKDFLSRPENKGKVLNTGLWKYTRHPNYFGEVTMWWGLWIVSLSTLTTSTSVSLLGIIGPLTITFLILKVSGIPLLEKKMAENPIYNEYRASTSVFFPWKVKNK